MREDQEKAQLWRERIQEQQLSGLSIHAWCAEKQLRPNRFFYWRKRFNSDSEQDVQFAEIPFKQSETKAPNETWDSQVQILYKEFLVLIGQDVPQSQICAVLEALRHSC